MSTEFIFGEIRALPDNVDETRTVEFIISNENRDRHGTVIKLNGWRLDNYRNNPIVGYQHNLYGDMCNSPNPDDIIGKSEVFVEGKNLIGRLTFEPPEINPLAEKIFQKVKFGTLRTASVGFMPHKATVYGKGEEAADGKNPTEYYEDVELMEWSIVNIPSNPTALKREFSVQSDRAVKYLLKAFDGKVSIDDLMKMTVKGVIGMLTGESLQRDINEKAESDIIDREETISVIRDEKLQRELNSMKARLAFNNDFDELERREAKEKYDREYKARCARKFASTFYDKKIEQ